MNDYQPSDNNAPALPADQPLREPVLTRSLGRQPAFTLRALVIGAVSVCALAVATPINDWVLGNTYLYNNHLPLAGTVLVLFLAMLMFLFSLNAAGRSLGVDAWLRRHVPAARDGTGKLGRILHIAG